ncbi:MAG: S24 family peptidase [Clostridia bacterium]
MSRLGDRIRQERIEKGVDLKELAKKSGVTVSFLMEVESGRKIINDAVASRILKIIGSSASIIDEFEEPKDEEKGRKEATSPPAAVIRRPSPAVAKPNERWEDALSSLIKRVAVYDMAMNPVDFRMMPVREGKIEGYHPDKVFYVIAPDNSLSGFRILKGDRLFVIPVHRPVNNGIMMVEYRGMRQLRKIRRVEGNKLILMAHDRQLEMKTVEEKEISIIGQCIRVEFDLSEA